MSLTKNAFDQFRSYVGQPRSPAEELIANDDQRKLMSLEDGLMVWTDGVASSKPRSNPPLIERHQTQSVRLWVVREDDVVHAAEQCPFGASLESGVIKHTNLTGAQEAYSGGELLFLDESTVVVNGRSGRYGPRSKLELDQVVRAFAKSGYGVWSMGFDEETNRPLGFVGTFPEWVE